MDKYLDKALEGKVVIIGIGNTLRGDDGAGVKLVQKLSGKVDAVVIDAGTSPENHLGKIVREKPDTVLLIDAAQMGMEPGAHKLFQKKDILKVGFSTHDMPPSLFMGFLTDQTKASVYMLGIQPLSLEMCDELSKEVEKGLHRIEKEILRKKGKT